MESPNTRLDKIYEVSAVLFRQKGYDGVKIDEICDRVGISKPTLYAQHLTKRDLFIHMYKPCREKTFIEQKVCDVNRMVEEIFRAVDLMADRFFYFGPELLRDLLRLHLQTPALDDILDHAWKIRMAQLIHAAQIRNQIRNQQEPRVIARIITACIIGYGFQYAMNQAEESRSNLHESVEAILQTEQVL